MERQPGHCAQQVANILPIYPWGSLSAEYWQASWVLRSLFPNFLLAPMRSLGFLSAWHPICMEGSSARWLPSIQAGLRISAGKHICAHSHSSPTRTSLRSTLWRFHRFSWLFCFAPELRKNSTYALQVMRYISHACPSPSPAADTLAGLRARQRFWVCCGCVFRGARQRLSPWVLG